MEERELEPFEVDYLRLFKQLRRVSKIAKGTIKNTITWKIVGAPYNHVQLHLSLNGVNWAYSWDVLFLEDVDDNMVKEEIVYACMLFAREYFTT